MNKTEKYLLFFGILLTLIAPTILTLPAFSEILNFSGKGEIGSTIGGITSPIVGLIGAIMVFITFKEQAKANLNLEKQIIQNQHKYNFEILQALFNDIKEETEKVEYDSNVYAEDTNPISKGINAIKEFSDNISGDIKFPRPSLNNFSDSINYLFTLHTIYVKTLKNIDLSADFKLFITSKHKTYYNLNLSFYIDNILFYINKDDIDGNFKQLNNILLELKQLNNSL